MSLSIWDHWLTAALSILVSLLAGAAPPSGDGPPGRRALLVGIEAYRGEVGWVPLEGPHADVEALRLALLERAGFRDADITVLLDEKATRNGIVNSFREMIDSSGKGDLLVFYFSGHGSQLRDQNGDEAADGLDETLVPYDALLHDGTRNDLRDDEIGELVEIANRKTDQVVLLFDCCNSGTNVRGSEGERIRWVPGEERNRGFAGRREGGSTSVRNVDAPEEVPRSYVPPNLRYVHMSACRSREAAAEILIATTDGKRRFHGAFTYALVQQIYHMKPGWSYLDLMDRVRDRVRQHRPAQTPVIEGPLARESVFTGGAVTQDLFFGLAGRDGKFVLEGGQIHGLRGGSVLSVCPGDASRDDASQRVGRIRIVDTAAAESTVEWIGAAPAIPEGETVRLRAFESERGPGDTRLRIAVMRADRPSRKRHDLVEAIERDPAMALADPSVADFLVETVRKGEDEHYRLATMDGTELPLLARTDSEAEIGLFVLRLSGLARAHRILQVRNDDSPRLCIDVTPLKWETGKREPEPIGASDRDRSGIVAVDEGQVISFRIRNCSEVAAFVSLVVISPDGQIGVPWTTPEDEPIPPGEEIPTPRMLLQVPEGADAFYRASGERFRFVVTSEPHDLRTMEQLPVTRLDRTRGVTIDASKDGVFSGTKALPRNDWLTVTLELRTVRNENP